LKVPVPEPSLVFVLKEIVGVELVDHTTPLEVTAEPPSELIVPPEIDAVDVIAEIEDVVTVGGTVVEFVVKMTRFPYPVPALLVA
jgi:hypothetical protein